MNASVFFDVDVFVCVMVFMGEDWMRDSGWIDQEAVFVCVFMCKGEREETKRKLTAH